MHPEPSVRNVGELRDLLRQAELAIAGLKRGTADHAIEALRTIHAIEKVLPRLEGQSAADFRAERTRLQTLEGALRSNASLVVKKAGKGRLQELRRETGAGPDDWWVHLDLMISQERSQQVRRLGIRVGAAAVVLLALAAAYQFLLAPRLKSRDGSGLLRQAEDYLTTGQLEQALSAYTAVLEADPEGSEAPLALGAILTQLGRDAEAQPYFDQARGQLSEAEFHASLALLYYKLASQGGLDTVDRAEQAALAALEADGTSALACLALGSVYELRGDVGRAIEALSKASDLSTDDALTASIKMRLAMLSQRPPELPTPAAD